MEENPFQILLDLIQHADNAVGEDKKRWNNQIWNIGVVHGSPNAVRNWLIAERLAFAVILPDEKTNRTGDDLLRGIRDGSTTLDEHLLVRVDHRRLNHLATLHERVVKLALALADVIVKAGEDQVPVCLALSKQIEHWLTGATLDVD